MGYSITIRCKNKKVGQRMYRFLTENYREPHVVLGDGRTDSYSVLRPIGKASYDHRKLSLGFDYGAVDLEERFYIYTILAWMAIKAGRTFKFAKLGHQYYYMYDGGDSIPLVVPTTKPASEIPSEYERYLTDERGFKPYKHADLDHDINKIISDELDRLNTLWEKP